MILEATHPPGPHSFGELLRGQREAAGVSLDTICDETKISRRILLNLESGSFKHLPEKVFSRSFVSQYAAMVGSDPATLLDEFESAWSRFEEESGEFRVDRMAEPPPKPPIRWGFWFPMAFGALILTTAAVVILSGSEPGQAALVGGARSSAPHAAATMPPSVTPTGIAAVPPTAAIAVPVTGERQVVALTIRVARDKECWINYRDREGRTDQRLLMGGTLLRLELEGPVKLTIGNAGAATLEVGGVEYTDLGAPGQVVHTEVSDAGLRTLGAGAA